MKQFSRSIMFVVVVSLAASACSSNRSGRGNGPDEFRVLTKAPLSIPPEYNLIPPRPGDPRPQDLQASQAARIALLGGDGSAAASVGEQVLVAAAKGDLTSSSIRAKLDSETNRQVNKPLGFANRILFWRDGDTYIEDGTMLDADAEAERLRRKNVGLNATGGNDVVIRKDGNRIKLPGL
ncbi:MAG: hypothetical protein COA47_08295 [Robiginitomaculum sp.]|nr:MAG: hypothetical protein COA47_08295 [Robiginitomaculum sp.]